MFGKITGIVKKLRKPSVWCAVFNNLKFNPFFKEKLNQNYHSLTWPERAVYWLVYRPFWDKEKRFFFEGSRGLLGQMYVSERRELYETITKYKPKICFEIGTWTGGGSTFFIASAFAQNGVDGHLVTMENDAHLHQKAADYYANKLPELDERVEFVFGDNPSDLFPYIEKDGGIECLFLDGAEDARQTLEQYQTFLPRMKKGSVLMAHDWLTDKMETVKPLLLSDDKWEMKSEILPPDSVGFVVFERL